MAVKGNSRNTGTETCTTAVPGTRIHMRNALGCELTCPLWDSGDY